MDLNIYRPVQSLQKSAPETGGLCGFSIFKIEDVLYWPPVNPVTGIISEAIQFKEGKSFYIVQAADPGRSFDEEMKYDNAGPYADIKVDGSLAGHNSANILTLQAAPYHRWGAIITDRSGVYRLIGSNESGARFTWKYTSGDVSISRKTDFTLTWQPAVPAPLYQATTFNITIGGVSITAGKLTLLQRFRVGDPGAPMVDGQEVLTNPAFANRKLLIIVNAAALPCDDGTGNPDFTGSLERRYQKTDASDTATFLGGVIQGELIEIYAYA